MSDRIPEHLRAALEGSRRDGTFKVLFSFIEGWHKTNQLSSDIYNNALSEMDLLDLAKKDQSSVSKTLTQKGEHTQDHTESTGWGQSQHQREQPEAHEKQSEDPLCRPEPQGKEQAGSPVKAFMGQKSMPGKLKQSDLGPFISANKNVVGQTARIEKGTQTDQPIPADAGQDRQHTNVERENQEQKQRREKGPPSDATHLSAKSQGFDTQFHEYSNPCPRKEANMSPAHPDHGRDNPANLREAFNETKVGLEKAIQAKEAQLQEQKQDAERNVQLFHNWYAKQIGLKDIEIERLTKERDGFRLRLSKLAGEKLTEGNPNIADLSDPNRPTELSRRYGEIYDNEWSDAYDVLHTKTRNEEDTILFLREIMTNAYDYCQAMLKAQLIELRKCLIDPTSIMTKQESKGFYDTLTKQERSYVKDELFVTLKDFRRKYATQTVFYLTKDFIKNGLPLPNLMEGRESDTALTAYVQACVDVCWYMVLVNPPVVLSLPCKGASIDLTQYKEYTRSAKGRSEVKIEFTVWPCLLLHAHGPILSKGIVQPEVVKTPKSVHV